MFQNLPLTLTQVVLYQGATEATSVFLSLYTAIDANLDLKSNIIKVNSW